MLQPQLECIVIPFHAYRLFARTQSPPAPAPAASRGSPSPAAAATPARNCCASLARHPAVRLTLATSSSAASAARRLPALTRLWNGALTPLDQEALVHEADIVFMALPDKAAATLAPALLAAGVRVIDVSGAFRLRDAALRAEWYPETGEMPAGRRLRPDRVGASGGASARSSSPIPAAIRPRRCSRCCRWCAPACCRRAPTSSSTPSRACRVAARRRPRARISPRCTAACRSMASFTTSTAPKSNRSSVAR